jgi:acetyl esterase/lipase
MGMRVRVAFACLLFALSLLVILPAPNLPLWILTVGVTEWGHWPALVTLLLLTSEWRWGRGVGRLITSVLCVIAISLFVLPLFQAIPIAHRLPDGLRAAFGPRQDDNRLPSAPLRFARLWWPSFSEGVQVQSLHYNAEDGTPLALDYFSDSTLGDRPCILVVHGGAWHTGNARELQGWNYILARLGYRVASISYRLAPNYHWPAQKHDVLSALAYLKANASPLGIDPHQFILLGRSAGAQIVLATAYAVHDSSIRGCVASYPPTDMDFDYGTAARHSILDAHQVIGQFLGGTPDRIPDLYRDASPLQLADADSAPTLLAQGSRDEIVWIENSRKLRDRLEELHRPVYLLEMPWATHGFDANPSGPGGQLEYYAITWFISAVLKK